MIKDIIKKFTLTTLIAILLSILLLNVFYILLPNIFYTLSLTTIYIEETGSVVFCTFIITFRITLFIFAIYCLVLILKKDTKKLFSINIILIFVEIFTFIGILAFVSLYVRTFYYTGIDVNALTPIITGFGFTFTVIFLYRGALNNKKTLELSDKKQLQENFNGAVKNLESTSSGVRMGGVHSLMDFVMKSNSVSSEEKEKYEYYGILAYDVLIQHARETSHKLEKLSGSNNKDDKDDKETIEVELQETLDSMLEYMNGKNTWKNDVIKIFREKNSERHNRTDKGQGDEKGNELYPNWKRLYAKEINLQYMNLSYMYFRYANFTDAKLRNANFTKSELKSATLTNANLTDCNLTNTDLECAILINANLTRCNLTDAKIISTEIENLDITKVTTLQGACLINLNMINTKFEYSKLLECKYVNGIILKEKQDMLESLLKKLLEIKTLHYIMIMIVDNDNYMSNAMALKKHNNKYMLLFSLEKPSANRHIDEINYKTPSNFDDINDEWEKIQEKIISEYKNQ